MRDRLFYPLAALAAIAMIALAMNWPEGAALAPGDPPATPTPPAAEPNAAPTVQPAAP